jgi:hypothetical protein
MSVIACLQQVYECEVPMTRLSHLAAGIVLLACVWLTAQDSRTKAVPCPVKGVPSDWLTYVNRSHGYCFSYPPTYAITPRPWLRQYTEIEQAEQYTHKAAREHRAVRLQPRQSGDGAIFVVLHDEEPFNLQSLARLAPTGIEGPPEPKRIGTETFYFYGPGGGGVAYADSYFFDLRGKTLDFTFQAAPDNNIPSPYTQSVEEPMLQTFRTFSPK